MYFDIAANLADQSFQDDLDIVINRSTNLGVTHMIIAATDHKDSRNALLVANKSPNQYSTAGIHPCSASKCIQDIDFKIEAIKSIILSNKDKIKFLGELGLDYDRLEYSSKEDQHTVFRKQLDLLKDLKLNHGINIKMYLHSRNCADDFIKYLEEQKEQSSGGVVHSYTGNSDELSKLLDLGYQVGVNGCSLKTEENVEVVKLIPQDKICIETDCPQCEIRKSSASAKFIEGNAQSQLKQVPKKKQINLLNEDEKLMVVLKGRNEPCGIINVSEAVSKIRGENYDKFVEQVFHNTLKLIDN